MSRTRALVAAASLLLSMAVGSSAMAATNPMGIAFSSTTNTSLYARSTGVLITGRCNRYDSAFQTARTKGGEVLAYINTVERPSSTVCSLDKAFYMNDYGKVPLWPYPSYGVRTNYSNHKLTDIRKGSAWSNWVVSYVEKLMRENKVDGVFLDVLGARLWTSAANWGSWSQSERDQWTDGAVDLVRRIDAKRRSIRPTFLVINNGKWDRGDSRGFAGEKYVDGVMLEHPASSQYQYNYANRTFGNLGQRRVLVVANTTEDALAWSKRAGVTHVSNQTTSQYKYPNKPVVSFHYIGDR
ncbi:MAG TPA: hypothetical protein VFS47_01690 [Steroidobacteraceae bacterium]|nr:hypothetical protein [Steroidobacteraceae bacterium]